MISGTCKFIRKDIQRNSIRNRFLHIKKPQTIENTLPHPSSSTSSTTQSTNTSQIGSSKPVGIIQSWKALAPFERLAVICTFTFVGLGGLYLIGDEGEEGASSWGTGSWLRQNSVARFFSWVFEQARNDSPFNESNSISQKINTKDES